MPAEPTTTQLLHRARGGDRAALDRLFPRLYDELRHLAHARLRRLRPSETLNTTAVVHEAYLRLTAGETPAIADRTHFFALAARTMRFVIIGYARKQAAQKRGGDQADVRLDNVLGITPEADAEALDLLTLDQALDDLAIRSERLAEVVELRFFGGLQYDEIAQHTGRSVPTVKRDWYRARAWLYQAIREPDGSADGPSDKTTGDPPDASSANEE